MIIHSPQELALYINEQRKKLKLSQQSVSELVGLKQKTISGFENNPEQVKLETLFRILSALDLNLEISAKENIVNPKKKWREEW
ncbi:MAG TPA: helix-turn-helix domain-containing protein [Gammaproteobacteria bacterium]|nr:helix-turn-helix domain-containing protein [Gammaproteobacteria bacterium]